jgi:hypothetical protein
MLFVRPILQLSVQNRMSGSQIRLSSLGFLDSFDLFDSSRAALPGNFLQLALLSFVSVLARDLPLQKSAIA